jgi:hypothetical protein
MATTPLQGWTVPAGSQAPATAADFATLAGAAEKQSVMVFATTAAMDTAIPAASRKAGMIAWITNLGRHVRVTSDAQAGTLGPLAPIGSISVTGTPLVGTYDATKPLELWVVTGVLTTNASAVATVLASASIGSGCVLWAHVTGTDGTYSVRGVPTGSSGSLVATIWNGASKVVSSSVAATCLVLGQ